MKSTSDLPHEIFFASSNVALFQKLSYLLLAMQFEYKIKLKVNIKKTCTEKKNSKKMTKIVQNTFKRVDFPHPLGPISIQNYLQGMQIEQSLRIGTSCVCLFPLKKNKNCIEQEAS